MKILVNGDEAICNICGHRGAEVATGTLVVCSFCFSTELKDKNWNVFIPKWKKDSRNPTRGNWTHYLRRRDDVHPLPSYYHSDDSI